MNNIETMKTEYETLQVEINKLKQTMIESSKPLILGVFKDFFEKYNGVVANVFWTQYTNFFNDGDPCKFNVNDVFLTLQSDLDDKDWEDDSEGSTVYTSKNVEKFENDLKTYEEYNKDPMKAAREYQSKCLSGKNGFRSWDPFEADTAYKYGDVKTSEQKMKNWCPFWRSYDSMKTQYEIAKAHVELYPNLGDDFETINRLISSIDNDIMEAAFGNHVKVLVAKYGVEIEEYDHD